MNEQYKATDFIDIMLKLKTFKVKCEHIEYKNNCLLSIIKVLIKSGSYENVIDSFITDSDVDPCFVYIFIETLIYKQKTYNILELYKRMRNNKIDKNTHSLLIR